MPSAEVPANPEAAPGVFGVVGFGRMAQALVTPLIESGQFGATSIRAAVASEASCQRLAASGLQVSTNPEAAWACPVVVLAVKPQQLEAAASAAGGQGGLLISVLAGVRLQRLQELFPQWRCVRAVPNTPALVRSGLTGLAWGPGVEAAERTWVRQLFGQVGEVLELPEAQLDPFLALTSSGPAFVALVAEALADGAVAAGLPRALASHLAHRTLAGSAALLHEQELHPGQLKDMVGSPAGTTMAGIRQLERAGLRSALIEAVLAATERSRELG
jgi:pyrroline-5-carboxylate reductase